MTGHAASRVRASGPIPSLDGIRGLAVSMVFLAHAGLDGVIPGGLGVTVFFVLSGYLISTLMRIEHAATGGIDFRAFYLRRLLRLMPPLAIVVAAAGLAAWLGLVNGGFDRGGLFAALFYFGNYYMIAHDHHGVPAGLAVLWSLAVEEHYYLFYPPLAWALLRMARVERSVVVLALLCLAVLAWRCWLVLHGASSDYVTMATDTRFDAILVGCIMALRFNPWLDTVPAAAPRRDLAIAVACVATLLATVALRSDVFRLTLRYTLQSIAIAPLIYLAVARSASLPFRWLRSRSLVYLGTVSYTIYLAHHVILLALLKQWPQLGWGVTTMAGAVLTLGLAEAMRRWVEAPCAALRRRLHRHPGAARAMPALTPARIW